MADENRFGFPSLPLTQHEKKEERSAGENEVAEKAGRKAFRNARHLLEEVYVSDEGIMGWVADMLSKTYDREEDSAVPVGSN